MQKVTLEETVRLINNIKAKGLKPEFNKHIAYLSKMKRKGFITEAEYIKGYDSYLIILGQ